MRKIFKIVLISVIALIGLAMEVMGYIISFDNINWAFWWAGLCALVLPTLIAGIVSCTVVGLSLFLNTNSKIRNKEGMTYGI